MSVAYTLPFASPQRVSGPGTNSPADLTLPEMYQQQCVFSNGGATRYMILVNGPQATFAGTNPTWNPAGGTPSTRAYIHVMKSIDGGATWNEVGTLNAKQLPQENQSDGSNTQGFRTFSAVQSGTLILIARPTWDFASNASADPRPIVVSQFDMATDDWGADLSAAGDPQAPVAYITHGLYPAYCPFFLIERPSDGHLFLEWRFFDLCDNSKSGTQLVIEASGAPSSGTDLFITGGGLVGSVSYTFVLGDVGKTVNIPASAAAAGFLPGNYIVTAISGGQFIPDRPAGEITASGGSWILTGTNAVSDAGNPFTAADVNQVLTISAHAGFNAGQYGIASVDGGGIATVYHIGPPLNQTPGTLASSGAHWTITNQTRDYERTMLSELTGGVWATATMIFGTVGDFIDYEPAGMCLGDSDRIHCFAQKMEPLPDGNGTIINTEEILSLTLKSDNSTVGAQSFLVTDRAPVLPLYPPYSRIKLDTTREIILPYTFIFDPPAIQEAQNCEMRVYRGDSADTPTFSSEVVSTGNGTVTADAFDSEFGSYPVACDLNTATLYLMTVAPFGQGAPFFVPFLLNLFTDVPPWDDPGVSIFDDSGGGDPRIGPVGCANNYPAASPAFIGMALTNGPNGEFQYDDPFYFELDFGGGGLCQATLDFGIQVRPRTFFNGSSEQLLCDDDYPWLKAPAQAIPKNLHNSITAPATGVLTEIFSFLVPDGMYLVIDRIFHNYIGTGFVEGSGGILFFIDVNRPIGNPLATGRPVAQFVADVGTTRKPQPVGPLQFAGGDTIRYKVLITDPTIGIGLPNVVNAAALGWLYPKARYT